MFASLQAELAPDQAVCSGSHVHSGAAPSVHSETVFSSQLNEVDLEIVHEGNNYVHTLYVCCTNRALWILITSST